MWTAHRRTANDSAQTSAALANATLFPSDNLTLLLCIIARDLLPGSASIRYYLCGRNGQSERQVSTKLLTCITLDSVFSHLSALASVMRHCWCKYKTPLSKFCLPKFSPQRWLDVQHRANAEAITWKDDCRARHWLPITWHSPARLSRGAWRLLLSHWLRGL